MKEFPLSGESVLLNDTRSVSVTIHMRPSARVHSGV